MKKTLLVIDMQNDFIDMALGTKEAVSIVPKVKDKIKEYIQTGNEVIFTRDTHGEDYLKTTEGKHLPVPHCIKGTHGWQNYGETAKALEEVGAVGIDKLTFGMDVADPAILAVLPENAERIEICGLVSNICVVSNAAVLQGHYPNAQMVVDARLTASFDPDLHEKTLDVLRGLQVEILNRGSF